MDRPKLEVAEVFRRYGAAYRDKHGASMSTQQRRVMAAIEVCWHKTDCKDSWWLAHLLRHCMATPSFIPPKHVLGSCGI